MAPNPSERDMKFFFHVLLHLNGGKTPDTDWEAVTSAMELKSANVTKTRFGQIMKKYKTSGDTETTAKATPSKTAATPSKRKKATPKRKKSSDDDEEDSPDPLKTPSKKPKIKPEPEPEPEPEEELDASEDF